MEKLSISAGQICIGDILNGLEVDDFDIRGNEVFVKMIDNNGYFVKGKFDRGHRIIVETDYLERAEDDFDSQVYWEDAIEDDIAEMNSQDAKNIKEDIGDLLDY